MRLPGPLALTFDYTLPPARIAKHPAEPRDSARLLVLDGGLSHRAVRDLPSLLESGDLLVANDTKVLPARLRARRPTGARVEVLLVRPEADGSWRALRRSRGRVKPGDLLHAGEAVLRIEAHAGADWRLRIAGMDPYDLMARHGEPPLPPYLRRPVEPEDAERYQTRFARVPGAIAAPTAGLHFTPGLLGALKNKGVGWATLTLHVGPGTFRTEAGAAPEPEWYGIPEETLKAVGSAGRVVAVGTTSARALETWAATGRPEGWTDLVIGPGFRFRAMDALMTNFHLPGSSLLALVSAFAGRERVAAAYAEVLREGYRFYSYGDAMLALTSGRRPGSRSGPA
jgi:S-adenosylmethionine:tRNA ribosyltransferase-isomerase